MENDASLFSSLSGSSEENIYVTNDYVLTVIGNDDVECHHGRIENVYHVPIMSAKLLLVSQLTKTKKLLSFGWITL